MSLFIDIICFAFGFTIGCYACRLFMMDYMDEQRRELESDIAQLKQDVAHYRAPWDAANEHIITSQRRHEQSLFFQSISPSRDNKEQNDIVLISRKKICSLFQIPESIVGEATPLPLWGDDNYTSAPQIRDKEKS